MQIQFIQKLQFTKLLKAHGRLREFNFLNHNVKPARYYSVDTVDDRNNRIIFSMQETDGEWKIRENAALPGWITDIEKQLIEIIMEETR